MLAFSNHFKSQTPQRAHDLGFGSVNGKFGHGIYTTASATKASRAGFSASKDSGPNVLT
jgi:hypothetical protein